MIINCNSNYINANNNNLQSVVAEVYCSVNAIRKSTCIPPLRI